MAASLSWSRRVAAGALAKAISRSYSKASRIMSVPWTSTEGRALKKQTCTASSACACFSASEILMAQGRAHDGCAKSLTCACCSQCTCDMDMVRLFL